jgi:hypothetical protein
MNELKFRRIKGRVIPIRERKSKVIEGAGTTIAGLGAGAVSGEVAGRATNQAVRMNFQAGVFRDKADKVFRSMKFGRTKANKWEKAGQQTFDFKFKSEKFHPYTKLAVKKALKSKGFRVLNKGLRITGLAVSAGLIGHGLKNLYEGATGNPAEAKQEVITNAAGAGAAFAFHSAFGRKMGIKNFLKYGWQAAKTKVK